LRFPPLLAGPVLYAPVSEASAATLLWRVAVWMPLDTVLPEELAFRGVLLASLMRRLPTVPAALVSAGVFTLWHAVIVSRTLAQTNLRSQPVFFVLGFVGAFGAIFVGGLLFATLRIRTRHLAGSMLAHWAFNTLLLLGLARS
jgi:membrane protease YdiL (CAAX protease family)